MSSCSTLLPPSEQVFLAYNDSFGSLALNPADQLTEVRGIPDESAIPSVMVNYQTIFAITPQVGAVGTWSLSMAMTPHPINFASYTATDSVGSVAASILNTQIAGGNHSAKYTAFTGSARRWRLAYYGATLLQDGADLTNQGTIVCSQAVVKPLLSNANLNNGIALTSPHVMSFDPATDLPVYAESQTMPNAYFNRSKEGAYVPLKLTRTCQEWRSFADSTYLGAATPASADLLIGIPAVGNTTTYPFYGLTTVNVATGGQVTSPLCNDVWGMVNLQNISVNTSIRIFFRCGYELQVSPGTELTPFQMLSPSYDPLALADYFGISRELKDAYPEEYNSAGKIWDEISTAIKSIAAPLAAVPGLPSLVGMIGSGVAGFGDYIKGAIDRSSESKNPSASQVEKGKEAVKILDAATAPAPARVNQPSQQLTAGQVQAMQNIAANLLQKAFRQRAGKRKNIPGKYNVQRK